MHDSKSSKNTAFFLHQKLELEKLLNMAVILPRRQYYGMFDEIYPPLEYQGLSYIGDEYSEKHAINPDTAPGYGTVHAHMSRGGCGFMYTDRFEFRYGYSDEKGYGIGYGSLDFFTYCF